MESSDRNVLPAELCQRIYQDFVVKPHVPLSHILDFELYKVALFCILPKDFYLHLSNNTKIRHWLMDQATFKKFIFLITRAIEKRECNINIDNLSIEKWRETVVSNVKVYETIHHWRTGGEISVSHRWSILDTP